MFKTIEMTGQNKDEAIRKALAELGADQSDVEIEVLDEGESGGFLGFGRRPAKVRVTDTRSSASEAVSDVTVVTDDNGEDAPVFASDDADVLADDDGDASSDTRIVGTGDNEDNEDDDESEDDGTFDDEDESDSEYGDDLESRKEMIEETIQEFLTAIQKNMHLDNEVTVKFDGNTLVADIDGEDCGILIGRRGATLRSMQYLTSLYTNRLAGTRVELRMDIGGYRRKREHSVADLAVRTAQKALRTGNAFELNPMGSNDRRIVHETLADTEGIVTYSEGEEPRRYVVIDLEAAMPEDFEPAQAFDSSDGVDASNEEQYDGGNNAY